MTISEVTKRSVSELKRTMKSRWIRWGKERDEHSAAIIVLDEQMKGIRSRYEALEEIPEPTKVEEPV